MSVWEDIVKVMEAYSKNSRNIKSRVSFGAFSQGAFVSLNGPYTQIKNLKVTQESDPVPYNCSVSQSAEMTLVINKDSIDPFVNNAVKIETGIYCDPNDPPSTVDENGFYWVTLGIYKIDEMTSDDNNRTITVKAFDAIHQLDDVSIEGTYTSAVPLYTLFPEVTFVDTTSYPYNDPVSVVDIEKLKKYTKREALGYLAGLYGCFARTEEDGLVTFEDPVTVNVSYIPDTAKTNFKFNKRVKVEEIKAGTKQTNVSEGQASLDDNIYCISTPLSDISTVAEASFEEITEDLFPYDGENFDTGEYDTGELETTGNIFLRIGMPIYFFSGRITEQEEYRIWVSSIEIDLTSGLFMRITSNEPSHEFAIDESDIAATQADIDAAKQEAISTSNSYTDTATQGAVSSANTYTDEKIAEIPQAEYTSPNITAQPQRETTTDQVWASYAADGTKYNYKFQYDIFDLSGNLVINYDDNICLAFRVTINTGSTTGDKLFLCFNNNSQTDNLYLYTSNAINNGQTEYVFDVYYVFKNKALPGLQHIAIPSVYLFTQQHGGNTGTSIQDVNVSLTNARIFVTNDDIGLYKGSNFSIVNRESNFNGYGAIPIYDFKRYPGTMPAVDDENTTYGTAVFNGEKLILRDGVHEYALNASVIPSLLELIKFPRKIVDVPVYNKDDKILVPYASLNDTLDTVSGIKSVNKNDFYSGAAIEHLNLAGAKQLRVVFRRNDTTSSAHSSFGEITIPLEYPLPGTNGAEFFLGGACTVTLTDRVTYTKVMTTVWYPSGGSLADCNFLFNGAWTIGTSWISDMYIVAIYACY